MLKFSCGVWKEKLFLRQYYNAANISSLHEKKSYTMTTRENCKMTNALKSDGNINNE